MSGVFLIVFAKGAVDVLRSTSGGHPHVTLFYSGSKLNEVQLVRLGFEAFTMARTLVPTIRLEAANVRVNSFFEEKTQKARHDVLLELSVDDAALVDKIRAVIDLDRPTREALTMREPHVTHSIHYDENEAQRAADDVRLLMPLELGVTGFTID